MALQLASYLSQKSSLFPTTSYIIFQQILLIKLFICISNLYLYSLTEKTSVASHLP